MAATAGLAFNVLGKTMSISVASATASCNMNGTSRAAAVPALSVPPDNASFFGDSSVLRNVILQHQRSRRGCMAQQAASKVEISAKSRGFGRNGVEQGLRRGYHRQAWMQFEMHPFCLPLGAQLLAREGGVQKGNRAAQEQSPTRVEVVYNPKRTLDNFADAHDPSRQMRPKNLTLFSPAKINVFLRVTAKRPDGYHELASLFHAISVGDTLRFSVSPSPLRDSLTTTAAGVPLDDTNLIIRALKLFREKTGSSTHFWVHLEKRIPTGAGLGGGSSNAATALWAANQLCGAPASEAQLQEWAGEIGSDVPFFFSHGAAFCTGRGEIVEDVDVAAIRSTPMVLMKPPEACATADVYRCFKLEGASSADPRELLAKVLRDGISQETSVNDLEAPAFEVLPSLQRLKQRVGAASRGRYQAVLMSGSGSTIVGVGDPEPPLFLYDEPEYSDVFISEARFLTRGEGEWYVPGMELLEDELQEAKSAATAGTGVSPLDALKLPFSFEA